MKTLSLTIALAFIALFGFAQSNSASACSSCGCSGKAAHSDQGHSSGHKHGHSHSDESKPCCGSCGDKKKSCCGDCDDKKGECSPCDEAKAYYDKKKKMSKKMPKEYKKPIAHSQVINGRMTRSSGNWSSGSTSGSYNE